MNAFKKKRIVKELAHSLHIEQCGHVKLMEVCGTHTMSMFQYGLRAFFPEGLQMISGPGCPVCVTSQGDIDQLITLVLEKGVVLATFGDMLRVPGTRMNLAQARASGGRVEVVYSPMDALDICEREPKKEVVFAGIGFETTAPLIGATVIRAMERGLKNFSVYSTMKLVPPALNALLGKEGVEIDGLLCPGHVSAIIGSDAYIPISQEFSVPCVVAGFEPEDILLGILMLIRQINANKAQVENAYPRVVSKAGNKRAKAVMEEVFEPVDTSWRGLGSIPSSGLEFRKGFRAFSARVRFNLEPKESPEPRGCSCGEVLKGMISPLDCPLFGKKCTPMSPVGPCMVSSEGTCHAFYKYGDHRW